MLGDPELQITPTDIVSALAPLVSDNRELQSIYKVKSRPLEYKSVPRSDVDHLINSGWSIHREQKRVVKMKRAKPHDKALEDRIWCFLYRMGYKIIGGNRFIIKFKRNDGSFGKKQIDAFCCDEETAFIIECKSKEERGRRSLQKDILETIALQDYIRNSIFSLYTNKSKPKIIWCYATNNIIWSDQDVNRASDGNIYIITENEIQYFEAFLKHIGPAGRFQVLGEFLQGQKVPGIGEVKLPAIRGELGGETFYCFVTTPRRLLKIAFINHHALNHPDGRPAYQRMISSSRIKEIEKFIAHGGYFPTNILINFTDKPKFELISNKENTDPNIKFGWITLPTKYRSAWIIDGQHRLYGYSHLTDKFLNQNLFILAFDRMNTRKEADLFITINHKQKSVPKSLLVSLLADLRLGDSDPKTSLSALASAIIRAINADKTSPLARRFAIPGVPPESNQNLTISEAVNGLTRSGLIGKVVGKGLIPGPLSGGTDEATISRARKILNGYFDRIRAAHPSRWEAGKSLYISTNPGIRAQFMLISEMISYISNRKSIDFCTISEDEFINHIKCTAKPVFEYIESCSDEDLKAKFSRKFGEGGVREYLYFLFEIVHKQFTDFGSDEFKRWVSQKESSKVDDASKFIMELSEKLTNYVIDTLKRVHGTQRLESGDPAFWEIGIESRRVKDNAYKKQQEDKQERRKPKEAYFDLIDLMEIVKQNNNWLHFQQVFNLPKRGEKKGKKYYLDWMIDFNELRKIAAHKNALRTYSDDDIDFIEWLCSELTPRLDNNG
jgi:DGQHR domain-containing protein